MTRVAVCVATYRRPLGLSRLLEGLDALELPGDAALALELLVVDNDPDRTGADVCERYARGGRWPLRYEHEPRRGISQARNRGVECVIDRSDFIAFIDDDEVPEPQWLGELLRIQHEYEADVVAGPVLPRLEEGAAAWIASGGFFERARHRTGSEIALAITANALVRSEVLKRGELRFDERLGTTGGEDSHLFARIHRQGHRMVWADEAIVREWIPASRARIPWLLRRAYRSGTSWSMIAYDLDPRPATRLERVAKGVARVAQGALTLPIGAFTGRPGLVRALQYICLGAGSVMGAMGFRYEEYRKVHGS